MSKKPEPVDGKCLSVECKKSSTVFGFCEEHYEHYKFGLLKKTGEKAPDFDKKIEHFNRHQAERKKKAA